METTCPTKTASACHALSHGDPGGAQEQAEAGSGESVAAPIASAATNRIPMDVLTGCKRETRKVTTRPAPRAAG